MAEGGKEAIRDDEVIAGFSEVNAPKKLIRELARVRDKRELKSAILRAVVKFADKKSDLVRRHCLTRVRRNVSIRFAWHLFRKLNSRLRERSSWRGRYQEPADAEVLATIETSTDARLT
jgi:hypothetical protein